SLDGSSRFCRPFALARRLASNALLPLGPATWNMELRLASSPPPLGPGTWNLRQPQPLAHAWARPCTRAQAALGSFGKFSSLIPAYACDNLHFQIYTLQSAIPASLPAPSAPVLDPSGSLR